MRKYLHASISPVAGQATPAHAPPRRRLLSGNLSFAPDALAECAATQIQECAPFCDFHPVSSPRRSLFALASDQIRRTLVFPPWWASSALRDFDERPAPLYPHRSPGGPPSGAPARRAGRIVVCGQTHEGESICAGGMRGLARVHVQGLRTWRPFCPRPILPPPQGAHHAVRLSRRASASATSPQQTLREAPCRSSSRRSVR